MIFSDFFQKIFTSLRHCEVFSAKGKYTKKETVLKFPVRSQMSSDSVYSGDVCCQSMWILVPDNKSIDIQRFEMFELNRNSSRIKKIFFIHWN